MAPVCESNNWESTTVYCSLGLDDRDNDLDLLNQRKRERGFAVVLVVHDLISVVAPQFVGNPETLNGKQLHVADILLAVSEQTRSDAKKIAARGGIPLPETVIMPLASSLVDFIDHPERPITLPGEVGTDTFILNVGTISLRKNHHLLLDVWERLIDDMGHAAPHLVIAGSPGWLWGEVKARIERTPILSGKVHHLAYASDANLAWLYLNCSFTTFPSLYEGWGLPVTESLDFGKPCIASNATSVPEAGEGLVTLIDPIDRMAWISAMKNLWLDPTRRELEAQRIRCRHQRTDTEASTRRLLDILLTIRSSRHAHGGHRNEPRFPSQPT